MRVLAIDSSGITGTVAIVENEITIAVYTINHKKTHSLTLLPMIDEIVAMVEEDLTNIDAIVVAGGPGSFTGLRIGSATAKGLGLALGKPLISVPTLEGLAYQMYGCKDLICPLMDARRNQVYTGIYTFVDRQVEQQILPDLQIVEEQMAIDIEDFVEKLNKYGRKAVFLGDGLPVYEQELRKGLEIPFYFGPSFLNRQNAAALGVLGIVYYQKGKWETAAAHRPEYLRLTQAERERAERERAVRERTEREQVKRE